jgi:hypothetical protein
LSSCTGPCTLAVVLALEGRPDEGWAFVQERLATLGSSTTAFAEDMRGMSARLRAWLDRPVQ